MRYTFFFCLIAALATPFHSSGAQSGPTSSSIEVSEHGFDFEISDPGAPVEHTFVFRNSGKETVRLGKVALTPPLKAKRFTSRIEPGEFGELVVSLGTPRQLGEYRGAIEVSFKNAEVPGLLLQVTGKIEPVFEVKPFAMVFLAAQKGQSKSASLEIVNRDSEPAYITEVQHTSSRLVATFTTLEPGRRYQLTTVLKGDAPTGKATDHITVLTSSKKQPRIEIDANVNVRDRVYAFPDAIDFGQIKVSDLKARPSLLDLLSQTLMVYQEGGKEFQVQTLTDLPELQLLPTPSSLGDRYQIQVSLAPENLRAGKLEGFLGLKTNDPEFPLLNIPVKGFVEGSW